MSSPFWDEYKRRMTYGDALGPPRNATEMAAATLARHGKQSGSSGRGSRHTGKYDIELRFPARFILFTFCLSALFIGVSYGIDEYTRDETYLPYVSAVFLVLGGLFSFLTFLQVFINIVNFTLCRFHALSGIRALRYGFFAGIAAIVPSGFYFETIVSWILGGFLPAAATGALFGFLQDWRRKED